jgi:nitrogen fixation NifU-like protein
MIELTDLYQEVIIDHSKTPRNFMVLPHASHCQVGHNPLCGDQIILYLQVTADVIQELAFQGHGCAISIASASLMTEAIKGKSLVAVQELFQRFHRLVTHSTSNHELRHGLGKLAVFANIVAFPMRIKCATLAWHTMQAALADPDSFNTQAIVSTE